LNRDVNKGVLYQGHLAKAEARDRPNAMPSHRSYRLWSAIYKHRFA